MVVGLLAGILSSLRPSIYQGTARVLLRPNDPAEQLNPNNLVQPFADPNRYVTAQESIIESEAVAQQAAKNLPTVPLRDLETKVTVSQGGQSDILDISATDRDPVRARDMANAVAKGYIENRRLNAVAGLQRAADDITAKLGPLQDSINQLDVQIAAPPPAKSDAPTTPTDALRGTRDAAAEQYKTLYARQQELLVNIALKRGEAELVSEAKTPTTPISPKPLRDGAIGVLVGLLLGIGISLLREQMSGRLRSPEEVEQVTHLPLLAVLPYDDRSARGNDLATVDQPLGPLSEAIRSLRTSIQFLGAERPVRVIVITSSVPGEGKSLVAANLAVVCAEAGYSTHLVSGDLRRSSLSPWFGVPENAPGLSDLVARLTPPAGASGPNGASADPAVPLSRHHTEGGPSLIDVLVRSPISNLDVLPSGRVPPNPTELLGSRRMAKLLGELASSADIIIIDTPPLLPVTDAAILAAAADGVVFVTALGDTHRAAVARSKTILEASGVRILGVVVNKAPRSGGGYYNAYSGYYGPTTNGEREKRSRRARDRSRSRPMGDEQLPTAPLGSEPAPPSSRLTGGPPIAPKPR